jgi:hypothetical protein
MRASQSIRTFSQIKLQCVFDLVGMGLAQFSFSGYTRNDQAAAGDILSVVRRGDLVLRDLGYFSIGTFAGLLKAGADFLSRLRANVLIFDAHSGKPLNLVRLLKNADRLDWKLFVTSVDDSIWSLRNVADVYRLRWTIEIVFKAWESHLRLKEINAHSEPMLRPAVVAQLLHCTLMLWCWAKLQTRHASRRQTSLLRVARIVSACASLIACIIWRLTPEQMIGTLLATMSGHRKRNDRENLPELLANLCAT